MSKSVSRLRKTFGIWKSGIYSPLLSWQIFNALKAGSVFVLAILFARAGASLEFLSHYESLMLWAGLLSFFYVSGFSQAWISWNERLSPEEQKHAPNVLFWSLQLPALVTGGAFMGSALMNHDYIPALFGIYLCFHIPTLSLESFFLREKNSRKILKLGIWTYFTYMLGIGLVFFFTKDLKWVIMAMFFWAFLRWILTLTHIQTGFFLQQNLLKKFLMYSYPVVFSFLLGGSLVYINALMVERLLDPREFVLFRYGAREFPLFMIMANSFSTVYSGELASRWNKDFRSELYQFLKTKTSRLMHQLFLMSLLLMLSAPFLFQLAYGSELSDSWKVFSVMILLTLSRVLFPQTLLLASGHTRILMQAGIFELVTGLLLSIGCIHLAGIHGAAAALVLAFLAEKVFLIFRCRQVGIEYHKAFPWQIFMVYSMLLVLCFFMLNFCHF